MTVDVLERPPRPAVRVSDWRAVRKGSLRGFCTVETPSGLRLYEVAIHESHGKRWASPPGIPQLDRERRQRTDPATGKPLYAPAVGFATRKQSDRFSSEVIAALEAAGIRPFDDDEEAA